MAVLNYVVEGFRLVKAVADEIMIHKATRQRGNYTFCARVLHHEVGR
jgi:hypothetical protein